MHYPLDTGTLVLRGDRDWGADIEPVAVDAAGRRFDFDLEWESGVYSYFKVVLRDGGRLHWSQGENFLALATGAAERDVYPHFFTDPRCSECGLIVQRALDGSRSHSLRVFHPPGYDENTLEAFPVVYMQDGQNLFFPQEAFGGNPWHIDRTLRILDAMNLIRKVIVVGIYPHDRLRDYTQEGYECYGRFLVDEVKPAIDAAHRTLPGPETTVTLGSSLGGLVSLLLGWRWPQTFGHIGCLSSTFGWRDEIFERIANDPRRPLRIYLDSGWPHDNYEVTRAMRDLLRRRGYVDGKDLLYLAFPHAAHDETSWSMRAHIPFQFFFGD